MIKERIIKLIEYKGIPKEEFYIKIGMTSASFRGNAKKTPLNSNAIENILSIIPDVNAEWLITGKGSMLKENSSDTQAIEKPYFSVSQFKQRGYAPYYSDLLVSAGQFDLMNIEQREEPESWIKFPGIEVDSWFPVVGCSMEPKIYAGDIVGVKQLDSWELLDPDKTYLIITHDDRMIKHLETDNGDNSILWAVSENYKRFKITKGDIIRIFRVVWAGRFV